MKSKLQKTLVIVLGILCFSSFGFILFLDGYYPRTRPRQPQLEGGKVYLHYVKTSRYVGPVYLSRTDKIPYDYAFYVTGSFAVAAYLLNQRWRCFPPFKK